MLDYFLEHNVQKKLHIFSIHHINHSISVKELAKEVNISSSTITTLIDELNFDLEGIAEISKDNAIITINVCEDVTFFEIYEIRSAVPERGALSDDLFHGVCVQ